ncbi:MAG TPA: alpha/beta fold hydrolase [Acidocella sp.]|uniref:PHA/PHB synthase family protein n=1 Tax=Acidocella sp. TaxID=50710 RepID=UPI002C7BBB5B|nr:alpha/beta fold hydrolase [Acidocella sp.]HVE21921.1 alpha/beta fold hydrolase [Acidocella sp.]
MPDTTDLLSGGSASRARMGKVGKVAPEPAPPAAVSPVPAMQPALTEPEAVRNFDRRLHAAQARFTGGLSPVALAIAWADWFMLLANQPGRQAALFHLAATDATALLRQFIGLPEETLAPAPEDHRFLDSGWQRGYFALAQQKFLRLERFWQMATTGLPGLSKPHERFVSFMTRQVLDMFAPPNLPFLNPEVLAACQTTGFANLEEGSKHFIADLVAAGTTREQELPLVPGKDVAITPGQVVFRNNLIELIQYSPTTATVRPEPLLIVPAWIMKYYILDLSPQNSMVRYLVSQGFTVFCISWRNPDQSLRDVALDDYRSCGVMAAVDAVSAICDGAKIHAVGYCLGGTLLAVAAAAMARDHDNRLASLTLLAAQTDFTEAGELQLFISETQLAFLDDVMWAQGYLDSSQMAGAFQMLRTNDLIWSHLVRRYYLGEDDHPNDLMSWNMDATRMPYRMHSEYLRAMFLENDLAEGRFLAGGRKISLADIRLPVFLIGTETDHIAPWRSVYKFQMLNPGDVTFVLTSGGHNAGVVSEPGHRHRHFCLLNRKPGDLYVPPEEWQEAAVCQQGSWWPSWAGWLAARSGAPVPPPPEGRPDADLSVLEPAPGRYVRQR